MAFRQGCLTGCVLRLSDRYRFWSSSVFEAFEGRSGIPDRESAGMAAEEASLKPGGDVAEWTVASGSLALFVWYALSCRNRGDGQDKRSRTMPSPARWENPEKPQM